jgi:hypothetical protein
MVTTSYVDNNPYIEEGHRLESTRLKVSVTKHLDISL